LLKYLNFVLYLLLVLSALANDCMPIAEPYLCANLSFALQAAGNKQAAVRAEAEKAVSQICKNMSANAVSEVLKYLFAATDVECNWQTRALALKMIASFGDHAPEQLGFALPEVIITITYFPICVTKQRFFSIF